MRTKLNYLLMLLAVMMAQMGRAEIVTNTYDFSSSGTSDTEVTFGTTTDATYTNCNYFTKIGSVQDPGRFAAQGANLWILVSTSNVRQKGLYNNNSGGRRFLISNLYAGDIVTFEIVDGYDNVIDYNNSDIFSLESTSVATKSNNVFTMTSKGVLCIKLARYYNIKKITIQHDNSAVYEYDPAVEIYDLSGINSGAVSATNSAGYKFYDGGYNALILDNPSGYSLNNRVVVMNNNFSWDGGLKNTSSASRIVGINNLLEGDRVVITFSGSASFSSEHTQNKAFSAAGNVFKDDNNDGELNDGEAVITTPGTTIESQAVYTMTADGHLDISLAGGAKITKIEIYGDHQATMEDRYNGSAATGYTAYFSQTGQLLAKEHIVPGGLEVHIGNEDNTQHAIVVSSDQGPVSFVYDQEHYKMARQSNNGTFIETAAPTTGTFYKFMPEVDGYLTVNFKAYNIKYNNYHNGNGLSQGNEVVATSGTCPYYIMVKDVNNNFGRYTYNGVTQYAHELSTGANDKFENIRVTAGNTYYVYGWWSRDSGGRQAGTNGWKMEESNCGVAQLIDVTFIPDNMVTPLAKWVANTNWVESSSYVEELADVTGFTTNDIHIKKLSANIDECTPYISGDKLMITGVKFKEGANPGGTILIKLGNPSNDANPVFAYTIAYDASWKSSNWEDGNRTEGHTWDFSTNPLKGLDWTNTSGQASAVNFGTEAGPGLLYNEMHETNPDGSTHSDWTKTWRVINSAGEGTHDLMFLNKYDMEGDNADMMWDTEGLIFTTSSNQSCINNEFGGVVDHSKEGTRNDPDRYVGILPGGSFTIPALKAGDRVEIFMGSGDGSGGNACKLNITNALDAIGNAIDPADIYNGGGSPWEYNKGNESRYRGAYQFISTGGDMTFTMNGGSMTKLYSIKIYHGAKTATVDCTRQKSVTYNNEVYDGYTYSFNNDWRTTTPAKTAIALHYRGKGERLRTPTVVHQSGNVSTGSDNLFYDVVGDNSAPFIFYKSKVGDYGMFRMRVEDLELGNKYVADYALQNITVGYLEKKNYPYTWDFTDLMDYADTDTRIQAELTKVAGYAPKTETGNYDIEFMNNSVGEDVKAVEQWKEYAAAGDIPAGYGLQINNEPYSGGCMWTGGQLYAGDQPFDETYFLSIKVPESLDNEGKLQPDINKNYNGGVRICDEGLCLTGGNWTITLPQVSTDAAVYIRAHQVGTKAIYAAVGDVKNNASFTYEGTATDGTKDKIYAIKGTGEDMKLMFNNLIIKKIAVSTDPKTVNAKGWATESRARVIDPTLTSYMTGKDMRTYIVTGYNFPEKQVTLMRVDDDDDDEDFEGYLIPIASNGDDKACIIRNFGGEKVKILNDGFHLFIPDMHDSEKKKWNDEKKIENEIVTEEQAFNNLLVSQLSPTGSTNIPYMSSDGVYTNYAFSCTYYDINPNDGKITNNTPHTGDQAFYRIAYGGASSKGNQAYLPIEIETSNGSRASEAPAATTASTPPANFSIMLVNRSSVLYEQGDINGDGSFNKMDVNTMADHLAGRPTARFIKGLADMNGDGSIDIVDMTMLINKITGK